jgi:hypothetical protein
LCFPIWRFAYHYSSQWDDDQVRFVLDQHVKLDFYSASSLKQQSASRHVAPLWHIILIPGSFSLILRGLLHLLHIPKTNRANKKGLMLRRQWMAAYPWIYDILSCFLYFKLLYGIEELRVSVRFFTYIHTFIYYILRLTCYDL